MRHDAVKLPVREIDFMLYYLLTQPLSSVPFSLRASRAFCSFNSASYEKRGTMNVSGHEDREEVDSGEVRIKVLSAESDVVLRGGLVDEREKLTDSR